MTIPTISAEDVPFLTTEQMIEVDRSMVEDYEILLIQMMENAGRNLAHLARERFLSGDPRDAEVVVLAGSGGNGGGALVCARRLACWGARVRVLSSAEPDEMSEVPHHQLSILDNMGVEIAAAPKSKAPALVVDGILGYSLKGDPRGRARVLIDWANEVACPVLSLDAPSGVDTSTGRIATPAVRATATMTLALPKKGLAAASVRDHLGELYLADISVPPKLYAADALQLEVGPVFAAGDIVRVSFT